MCVSVYVRVCACVRVYIHPHNTTVTHTYMHCRKVLHENGRQMYVSKQRSDPHST